VERELAHAFCGVRGFFFGTIPRSLSIITAIILGHFRVFDAAFEPASFRSKVYNYFCGLVICVCIGQQAKKACFNVQCIPFGMCISKQAFLPTSPGISDEL